MPHFSFSVPLEKPLKLAFDDERAQARWIPLALLFEVRPAKHEEVVRDVGERDPHLFARHDVAVPALHRDGLNTAHVASGRRLGQAIRRELSPLCLRDEIPLFLILGPPGEERQTIEPRMNGHDDAQGRVDVLQLLAHEPEADVVHAGAAILLRHRTSEQPELRHLRKDLRVEPMRPIELPDARRHLAGAPFAHRALDQLMFFRKIEIHVSDVPEMRSELDCIARLSGQEVRTSTISLTPDLLSDRSPPLFMPLESRAARALGFANRHVHEQNPKPCDDHADTQEARKHQAASRRREVVPDQYRCHSDHQQRDPLPQPETSHAAIEVRSARRIDDHEKRRLYPAARVEDLEP